MSDYYIDYRDQNKNIVYEIWCSTKYEGRWMYARYTKIEDFKKVINELGLGTALTGKVAVGHDEVLWWGPVTIEDRPLSSNDYESIPRDATYYGNFRLRPILKNI